MASQVNINPPPEDDEAARRRRNMIIGLSAVAALLVIGLIALLVSRSSQQQANVNVDVQRSTATPSGVAPKGSTVVLGSPRSSSVSAIAPAGEARPPASRPAPTTATSERRCRRDRRVEGCGET